MYKVESIIKNDCQTEIDGKWMPSRPCNHLFMGLIERIRDAWMVLIGKYDAIEWPGGQ